jgi:hypothetical protein
MSNAEIFFCNKFSYFTFVVSIGILKDRIKKIINLLTFLDLPKPTQPMPFDHGAYY